MRRFVLLASLLVGVGVAYFFLVRAERSAQREDAASRPAQAPTSGAVSSGSAAAGSAAVARGEEAPYDEADFPIIAPLNAPVSTISRDLEVVSQVFEAWLSNFPHDGNPVGDNAEITAALMGQNRLGFALIPEGHPAVNARGELCDRWGTPFRFHQLSGTQMEIRSAGPDRRFATDDDAVWTPQ